VQVEQVLGHRKARAHGKAGKLNTWGTLLFHRAALSSLGVGRTGQRLLTVLMAVALLLIGAVALGVVRLGLVLTHVTILSGLILCTLVACTARVPSDLTSRAAFWRRAYLVGVYALMAAAMVPHSLRVLGLISPGSWNYGGYLAYSVASALLLGSLLLLNANEERLRRRREALSFAQSQREADAQRARAAEQSELMTMLTHELKTPLSVVSLALGNAGRTPVMQERAMSAVGNMRDVIDRCAQVSRIDDEIGQHDAAPTLQPVALQEVLAQAAAAHLQARRVVLPQLKQPPLCQADPQMLNVVVTNLLDNALKYSPKDSPVRATITPHALEGRPGLALRVVNKVGAAGRPDAERVFEKYHRGMHARHRSGSGLGLYLARRLTYRMAGELSLAASSDDEVCFELWMPC
jgi:signal transduction histidine kinase